MNPKDYLDYEIAASAWWCSWISNKWLQDKVGRYFAWKVKRKLRALNRVRLRKQMIEVYEKLIAPHG